MARPPAPPEPGVACLPTPARHALCKLFGRAEFTAEEVFALGYRRLQRAEGIGQKSLQAIIDWLAQHGLALAPPALPEGPPDDLPAALRQSIDGAVLLLRSHGYRVHRARERRRD
jgi:GNAT superfamily N-acetyltransferase